MSEIIYHVFFEDNETGLGLYIGSYIEKERAYKIGNYVWDLFENDGTDKTAETMEAARLWRKYKIFSDTEYAHFHVHATQKTTGITSLLVFDTLDADFVQKYILFRGTTQPELFTREYFEHCIMYQHKEKRIIAQKKAARRGKNLKGLKNILIINGFSAKMEKERFEITGLHRFLWKEIEVTQDFYNRLEKSDTITICMKDENIKSEIIDFEIYFRSDIELKARVYDEVTNILYLDLEDIIGYEE